MSLKLVRDSEGRPCSRCQDKTRRYLFGICPRHEEARRKEFSANPYDDPGEGPGPEVNYYGKQERW